MTRPRRFLPLLLIAALATATVGCAGWPVQEMSNARQAISAAQKAGAEKYAPAQLADARKLLSDASSSARKGDYRAAQEQADQSREKAIEARQAAEKAATADKPAPAGKAAPPADPPPQNQP